LRRKEMGRFRMGHRLKKPKKPKFNAEELEKQKKEAIKKLVEVKLNENS
jgi:hypothetical protein